MRGRAVALSDGSVVSERDDVDTWAPGPKDRVFAVGIDEVTGRLLRGAVDDAGAGDRGYL